MAKRPRKKIQPLPKTNPIKSGKQYKEATGSENPRLQNRLLSQTYGALWLADELTEDEKLTHFSSAISMLEGIEPKDGTEGMLATQMVGTHNAAMECLRRAMIPSQPIERRDENLKHATKLLSIYSRQIEVLDKHRGKGQQKVTVEYVNVESGGQAVVGYF